MQIFSKKSNISSKIMHYLCQQFGIFIAISEYKREKITLKFNKHDTD